MNNNEQYNQQKKIAALQQQIIAQQKLQELMQNLTNMCWDKCISSLKSNALSSNQKKCIKNCALRYKDVSQYVLEQIQNN